MKWKRRRPNLFLLLLVLAVIINILQFRAIDRRANHRYKALNRYDTACIIEIAYRSSPRHRQRYSPALALAEHAPGAAVIIPKSGSFSDEEFRVHLLTFGRASRLVEKMYDANIVMAGTDLGPYIVESGEEGYRYLPWAIATGSISPSEFIVVQWESPADGKSYDVLVDASLLPASVRQGLE